MGNCQHQHLEDLQSSGLSDETIQANGFYSATEEEVKAILGFDAGPGLAFPYLHSENGNGKPFIRIKPDKLWIDAKGNTAKYLSPAKSGNHLYFPHGVLESLQADEALPFIITEGEKKALKAVQEGFYCIALAGVWNFKVTGLDELLPDFNRFALQGRKVYICFDSDRADNVDIRKAEKRLAQLLFNRGAKVFIVKIPKALALNGKEPKKIGLDDYLISHGREEFGALLQKAQEFLPKKAKSSGKSKKTSILFPEIPACKEPVHGESLYEEIKNLFSKYLILPEQTEIILALWVLHTYVFQEFYITPYLYITSPQKRCGKTLLLDLIRLLSFRALHVSNLSGPVLFRIVDKFQPTLLIDEADTFLGDKRELIGIINSGNRKGGVILRCEGDFHDPQAFHAYSPKAIAGINLSMDTIRDRSIEVCMRRKLPQEKVESLNLARPLDEFAILQGKCLRWTQDNLETLKQVQPSIPSNLNDRQKDCWYVLLALAQVLGPVAIEEGWKAANSIHSNAKDLDEDKGIKLLGDIQRIFHDGAYEALHSQTLCRILNGLEESPWNEFSNGKPLTASKLASLLRPFGIRSRQLKNESGNRNGYFRSQFEESFARYLHAQNSTASTSLSSKDL